MIWMLNHRAKKLEVLLPAPRNGELIHLLIDDAASN
jgi:hypothetical protein